ncbi:MAG: hydantoinase/oxoprolinase family protein [Actinomycetia bacterium]|nr:hydantoinase/oxoprolinase family protein [Actinomycetes bacterium]
MAGGEAGIRIAADIGGTFTDVVVNSPDGDLVLGKALTNLERAWQGIREALAVVGSQLDVSVADLIQNCGYFLYSTTRATNAIVEGKAARTAFLVTAGFPDILLLREGGKSEPFNLRMPYPEPYVPRHLTFEITERVDSEGSILTPLDEQSVEAALAAARAADVEAIGVCLLWSVVNPAHELRVAELVEGVWPEVPVTVSHRLNPVIHEYRRASGTCIDASLKPLMQDHVRQLRDDLAAEGFTGVLFLANSVGGVSRAEDVIERPIYSVGSGPSLAPVAAQTYAEAERNGAPESATPNVIVCDTGGTSFDVGLITGGEIQRSRDTWIGGRFIGHLTGVSSVDIRSIGAGGGSIAWIDAGGLLRVGPQSAGSTPGPACYGRGGTSPTVTDAAVVLGYLDPHSFAGGRLELSLDAAREVVGAQLAEPLGCSLQEAASSVLVIAAELMVSAIKDLTVKQGFDPRTSLVVAGGGAAGLMIAPIARELGCQRVLVPRTAGALSACGGQFANLVAEAARTHFTDTSDFDGAVVGELVNELAAELDGVASSLVDVQASSIAKTFYAQCRYPYQIWDLEVPLPELDLRASDAAAQLEEAFHIQHEQILGVRELGQRVECLAWVGRLEVALEREEYGRPEGLARGVAVEPTAVQEAFFGQSGQHGTPRFAGSELSTGVTLTGPTIVDEPTTTIVVPPGSTLSVTGAGNYLLTLDLATAAAPVEPA